MGTGTFDDLRVVRRLETARTMIEETSHKRFIPRPGPGEYAEPFRTYVERVPEGDVLDLLATQIDGTLRLLTGLSDEAARLRYAPGKWSVKEVVGHLSDSERIFGYRALRFARRDDTPLPGFDENHYVAAAEFDRVPMNDLLAEFQAVRASTVALFSAMQAEWFERSGESNGRTISVRGILYVTIGHELHHREILRSRYGL